MIVIYYEYVLGVNHKVVKSRWYLILTLESYMVVFLEKKTAYKWKLLGQI